MVNAINVQERKRVNTIINANGHKAIEPTSDGHTFLIKLIELVLLQILVCLDESFVIISSTYR